MFEKAKAHFKKHRPIYVAFGSGLAVAGITMAITKGRDAEVLRVSDGSDEITVRPLAFLFGKQDISVVNVKERDGRGHPGYITRCLETNEVFLSQGEAARQKDVSPSILSTHLNGGLPDAGGLHFERLTVR